MLTNELQEMRLIINTIGAMLLTGIGLSTLSFGLDSGTDGELLFGLFERSPLTQIIAGVTLIATAVVGLASTGKKMFNANRGFKK
jgi:NADH:ubiquinone oxidoreductase subunit 4 (subunit M)